MPDSTSYEPPAYLEPARTVANKRNSDVFLINSPISEYTYELIRLHLLKGTKRPNAFVILVTNGGDPHAAYLIAKGFQRSYRRVTVCITGDCYSAGTIVVLGANELVMSEWGRLGPLDVQILKKDELGERFSGLTVDIALSELRRLSFGTFTDFALRLKRQYKSWVTFKTTIDLASRMTTALYSEIYRQIDPLKIGEDARAMQIAAHYGKLLETRPSNAKEGSNIKDGTVKRLLEGYPAHDCVIDIDEARELFNRVTEPNEEERRLIFALGEQALYADDDEVNPMILDLTVEKETPEDRSEDSDAQSEQPNEQNTDPTQPANRNGQQRHPEAPTPAGNQGPG